MTGSMQHVLIITRLTFREARRRSLIWIGLVLGGLFVAVFAVGFYFAHKDFARNSSAGLGSTVALQFSSFFLMAGLYVINFLVIMITVLTVVGTISGEIGTNTIHAIAAKPLRRWEIVLGKWLGHAIMLAIYAVLLSSGVIAAVYFISGYLPPNALIGIAILVLESLAALSVTLLGSTIFSTLANGVMSFMLYGLAFVGGWVEQIGSLLDSQAAVDIGIVSSLLMPSEALWRFAAAQMQGGGLMSQITSPFSAISRPTPAFVAYAGVYVVGTLVAATLVFRKRDF
jgi:Cu-processing system permease protein